MSETVTCVRCGREAPPPSRVLLAAEPAAEVKSKVCADCWAEWQKGEVVVINELRLNFMDPKSQEILERHMREFLCLDGPPAQTDTPSPFDQVTPVDASSDGPPDGKPSSDR
jgi:Fe-S cluster biosynthesis and repair protein YggX